MSNLTIIDGHNHLFRAFYGVPPFAKSKTGIQVNALYGFFASMRQIVYKFPRHQLFVVFDSETGITDKQNIRATYKAGRTINPCIFKQLSYVKQILDLMNVRWVEHPGYEADDIIASMATYWTENFDKCYIASNDFDFVQLVSDQVALLRTTQGQIIDCDNEFIRNKFNISPEQYIEYASIVGDRSDNICGIPRVGKQTASELLNKYHNLDGIYNNLDKFTPDLCERLTYGKDIAYRNRDFIKMNRHIPISEITTTPLPDAAPQLVMRKISVYLDQIGI